MYVSRGAFVCFSALLLATISGCVGPVSSGPPFLTDTYAGSLLPLSPDDLVPRPATEGDGVQGTSIGAWSWLETDIDPRGAYHGFRWNRAPLAMTSDDPWVIDMVPDTSDPLAAWAVLLYGQQDGEARFLGGAVSGAWIGYQEDGAARYRGDRAPVLEPLRLTAGNLTWPGLAEARFADNFTVDGLYVILAAKAPAAGTFRLALRAVDPETPFETPQGGVSIDPIGTGAGFDVGLYLRHGAWAPPGGRPVITEIYSRDVWFGSEQRTAPTLSGPRHYRLHANTTHDDLDDYGWGMSFLSFQGATAGGQWSAEAMTYGSEASLENLWAPDDLRPFQAEVAGQARLVTVGDGHGDHHAGFELESADAGADVTVLLGRIDLGQPLGTVLGIQGMDEARADNGLYGEAMALVRSLGNVMA